MTEREWMECDDPKPMLESLRGQFTQRKMRLFLCACCRQSWNRNTPAIVKRVIEAAEQYADAVIGNETFRTVQQEAEELLERVQKPLGSLAGWSLCPNARSAAEAMEGSSRKQDRRLHTPLLHDIFGNPFRSASLDRARPTPTIFALARSAYDERALSSGHLDPERLAVLSDALEEAGCDDADILGHLRSPGPHVRGCWVVDLVLGKE